MKLKPLGGHSPFPLHPLPSKMVLAASCGLKKHSTLSGWFHLLFPGTRFLYLLGNHPETPTPWSFRKFPIPEKETCKKIPKTSKSRYSPFPYKHIAGTPEPFRTISWSGNHGNSVRRWLETRCRDLWKHDAPLPLKTRRRNSQKTRCGYSREKQCGTPETSNLTGYHNRSNWEKLGLTGEVRNLLFLSPSGRHCKFPRDRVAGAWRPPPYLSRWHKSAHLLPERQHL